MGKKRQASYEEEFQIIKVCTVLSRGRGAKRHSSVWATPSDFLPKRTVWKMGKLQWRHLTNTASDRWLRATSLVVSQVVRMCPGCNELWMARYLCCLHPRSHDPSQVTRKKGQENPNWRTFCKIPDHYSSKPLRSLKIKESWETLTPKRSLRRLDGEWNMVSQMGCWNRTRILGDK